MLRVPQIERKGTKNSAIMQEFANEFLRNVEFLSKTV
jgi:hypothetical protein